MIQFPVPNDPKMSIEKCFDAILIPRRMAGVSTLI